MAFHNTRYRRQRAALVGLLVLGLWGCRFVGGPPLPAVHSPLHPPPPWDELRSSAVLPLPPYRPKLEFSIAEGFIPPDPILDASWVQAPGMKALVESSLASIRGPEAGHLRRVFRQMEVYRPWVEQEVRTLGFPRSLVFLPLLESGYNPVAGRSSGPMGLWQILPGTARSLGLRIDRHVDERRDPVASTRAALRYLGALREDLGSWPLALMAYNAGPGAVRKALQSLPPSTGGEEPDVEKVLQRLPSATRRFLPRFLALAMVGRDPESHGFPPLSPRPVEALEEVDILQALSLERVAALTGADLVVLRNWNPHLLQGRTPGGRPVRLRLPAGTGEALQSALLEETEAVVAEAGYREHVVAPGETLSHLARRYGVRLGDLYAANPSLDPRRIAVGARVLIPPPGG